MKTYEQVNPNNPSETYVIRQEQADRYAVAQYQHLTPPLAEGESVWVVLIRYPDGDERRLNTHRELRTAASVVASAVDTGPFDFVLLDEERIAEEARHQQERVDYILSVLQDDPKPLPSSVEVDAFMASMRTNALLQTITSLHKQLTEVIDVISREDEVSRTNYLRMYGRTIVSDAERLQRMLNELADQGIQDVPEEEQDAVGWE